MAEPAPAQLNAQEQAAWNAAESTHTQVRNNRALENEQVAKQAIFTESFAHLSLDEQKVIIDQINKIAAQQQQDTQQQR